MQKIALTRKKKPNLSKNFFFAFPPQKSESPAFKTVFFQKNHSPPEKQSPQNPK